MTEIIYAVHFITTENVENLKKTFGAEHVNVINDALFEVPNVLVHRAIHIIDPFDSAYKTTDHMLWLVSPDQLYENFEIIDDANRQTDFALLAPSKKE